MASKTHLTIIYSKKSKRNKDFDYSIYKQQDMYRIFYWFQNTDETHNQSYINISNKIQEFIL